MPNEPHNHWNGFHCMGCWPTEKPVAEEEIDRYLVPEWAVGVTDGEPVIGAQLPTKDGRKTGNAHIVEATNWEPHIEQTTYTVLTDAGNTLRCSAQELKELFHPPHWVSDLGDIWQKFGPRD